MNSEDQALTVGVIGLGAMGQTHLDVYAKLDGVRVAAVADLDEARLSGAEKAGGNIEGQAQAGFDLSDSSVKKYRDGLDLIADPEIHVVDICVPTPGHLPMGLASLQASKHTLIEKPLARTYEQALQLANAAEQAWEQHRAVSMCAMCMRFWPGWDWLRDAVHDQRYGKVLAATFRRVAPFPGGDFYANGVASGGAILDLHIHDLDFIRHAFGPPEEVNSTGYSKITGQPDHVLTTFRYAVGHPHLTENALVFAEGGWAMSDGFPFTMRYTVNFENATADFDLARGDHSVHIYRDGQTETPDLPGAGAMGYEHELRYFLDCVRDGQQADRITLRDAVASLKVLDNLHR
ncbi:MAG: Gfo/Idh/MocA family oxidoreductase [Planctomycetota bacterium]